MDKHINGFIAAPLTGFHPDGSVNLDIVPQYAAMLQANGVAGVFVNGTTGEGLSLTTKERCDLAARWVTTASDDFRVIIHVGHTCQIESQAMAVHAMDIGAHGMGEIGPIFFRPSSVDRLVDYAAATAAAAPDLPYYYYHLPSMSHVLFPMIEFLERASGAIPNLEGIKYTHEDLADYARCRAFQDGKYDILFGRDESLLEGLKLGAQGAVGSTYNVMAPLYQALVKAFDADDLDEAQRLQAISVHIIRILYETGGFGAGLKAVMRITGIDLGDMRRPQNNLSPEAVKQLEKALQEAGMFEYSHRL